MVESVKRLESRSSKASKSFSGADDEFQLFHKESWWYQIKNEFRKTCKWVFRKFKLNHLKETPMSAKSNETVTKRKTKKFLKNPHKPKSKLKSPIRFVCVFGKNLSKPSDLFFFYLRHVKKPIRRERKTDFVGRFKGPHNRNFMILNKTDKNESLNFKLNSALYVSIGAPGKRYRGIENAGLKKKSIWERFKSNKTKNTKTLHRVLSEKNEFKKKLRR